jgi:predicted phosphoribosyltransferase
LWRAYRLEQALAALRRDRGALETLTTTFDVSARQAQGGIDRLRELADSAGRRVEQQSATALGLKDDLALLIERGERLAERMDHATRAARATQPARVAAAEPARPIPPRAEPVRELAREPVRVRSQAERDLLMALQASR